MSHSPAPTNVSPSGPDGRPPAHSASATADLTSSITSLTPNPLQKSNASAPRDLSDSHALLRLGFIVPPRLQAFSKTIRHSLIRHTSIRPKFFEKDCPHILERDAPSAPRPQPQRAGPPTATHPNTKMRQYAGLTPPQRNQGVSACRPIAKPSQQLLLDLDKHTAHSPPIHPQIAQGWHDRFLTLTPQELPPIDASFKDLGKKCFPLSRFRSLTPEILDKISRKPTNHPSRIMSTPPDAPTP